MAKQKCIPALGKGAIYRDGKLSSRPADAAGVTVVVPALSTGVQGDVTGWLTLEIRQRLLEKSFEAVKRFNTPPAGESFIDEHGQPYSTPDEFAEQLADEFRERLFEILGLRDVDGVKYFLLGEPSGERAAVVSR